MPASERTDAKNPPVLERIGAYSLHGHVEATAAIQVYRAREDRPQGSGREIVLKCVQRASPENAELVHQLLQEAPTLRQLQHPCIVRTLDFFEHLDLLVFVLESIDGSSLAELLENQKVSDKSRLSDAAVLHIVVSVLDALAYAHAVSDASGVATPVVHKAVSPANVFVARDGTVKLGGFGFVKPFGISTCGKGRLQWESPCMAPEQIEGRSATPKADVYAAGLILWELLSGRAARVLPRHPLSTTALSVTTKRPDPLATVRPDLDPELTALVDAALASAPDERTLTCSDMARRIRKLAPDGAGKTDLSTSMRAVPLVSLRAPRSETKLVPRPSSRNEAQASGMRQAAKAIAAEPAVLMMPIVQVSGAEVSSEPAQGSSLGAPIGAVEPKEDIVAPKITPAEELLSVDVIVTDDAVEDVGVYLHTSDIRPVSLIDRLKKPTRWDRRTLLVIWAGLLILLVSLMVVVRHRVPTSPTPAAVQAAFVAPKEASMPAPTAPSEAPFEPELAAAPAETATPATADPPLPHGFARLTVHSSASSAMVYGKSKVYGSVEQALAIPCGRQFIRIGIPRSGAKQITWLGRGKTIPIACGRAVEITMGAGAQVSPEISEAPRP